MKKIILFLLIIIISIIAIWVVKYERDHKLIQAINSKDVQQVELAIANGGRINKLQSYGESPFHTAISLNRINIVKFLAENGAELNFPNKSGQYPLDIAISKGFLEIIKYLNEKGAKTKYKCIYCEHVILEFAVATNNIDGLRFIEDNGGNIFGNRGGFTLLHLATLIEKFEVVKYLIQKKLPVNALDNLGRTPLHCAIEDGNLAIINHLIENGADVKIKIAKGKHSGLSSVDLAKLYNNDKLYKYLMNIQEAQQTN